MKKANILEYKGYIAHIAFDPEAKIFYGRVINTRDTVTFQSGYAERLEDEVKKSVDAYISFCADLGEAPEKPFSGRFALRLSPEDHRNVALAAQLANKSLNAWVAEHLVNCAERELGQTG
jgi:predicted HicB family RNase H-like nuclease